MIVICPTTEQMTIDITVILLLGIPLQYTPFETIANISIATLAVFLIGYNHLLQRKTQRLQHWEDTLKHNEAHTEMVHPPPVREGCDFVRIEPVRIEPVRIEPMPM